MGFDQRKHADVADTLLMKDLEGKETAQEAAGGIHVCNDVDGRGEREEQDADKRPLWTTIIAVRDL